MRGKGGAPPLSFEKAFAMFGMEYFRFFDDPIRNVILQRFEQIVNTSSPSRSPSSPSTTDLSPQTLDRIDSYFRQEIFVLQHGYYSESLNSLSKIFGRPFVKSSSLHLNPVYPAQQRHSMGTLEEVKKLNTMLELHNQVYYLSLREFYRQREQLSH
jgi:hypothetical protein